MGHWGIVLRPVTTLSFLVLSCGAPTAINLLAYFANINTLKLYFYTPAPVFPCRCGQIRLRCVSMCADAWRCAWRCVSMRADAVDAVISHTGDCYTRSTWNDRDSYGRKLELKISRSPQMKLDQLWGQKIDGQSYYGRKMQSWVGQRTHWQWSNSLKSWLSLSINRAFSHTKLTVQQLSVSAQWKHVTQPITRRNVREFTANTVNQLIWCQCHSYSKTLTKFRRKNDNRFIFLP